MHRWEKYWIASGLITLIGLFLVYLYPSLAEPVGIVLVWLVGLVRLVNLVTLVRLVRLVRIVSLIG